MPRPSSPLNKIIPRKYAALCLALTASAFGFLAPFHPPINQTALAHIQPENQQAQLPAATQTQQNAQAAAVLRVQESLIAAVRNPQLGPAKYRTWLKQTQAEHEKT